MGDKVIPLTQPLDKPPLTLVEVDHTSCRHQRYEVHPTLPRCFCADCDTDLDPLWVLRQIAGEHRQRDYRVADLKRESAKLEKLVKRQMEGRRNLRRAEMDKRQIAYLQQAQQAHPSEFKGAIRMTAEDIGLEP